LKTEIVKVDVVAVNIENIDSGISILLKKDSNVIADIVNVGLVNDDIVEVDKISLFYLNR
jgi:hypothetical protein